MSARKTYDLCPGSPSARARTSGLEPVLCFRSAARRGGPVPAPRPARDGRPGPAIGGVRRRPLRRGGRPVGGSRHRRRGGERPIGASGTKRANGPAGHRREQG
ncbi:hypothetical protein EKG83_06730 [Saccharothrix syringae]|uniref:Uncharacterized protein n=1 Tax=Saccharothrix syringae TaxID=103733 RepID=A0A5Q0GTA6_SACSY|nr:hypothetical protein EKG83_06730 [Saccharothrix syringae]